MNKQIERILLGLLWLLAATLGTTFWLNTNFGFNIFSAQHWEYLSYLQAAQQPVRPMFYISLAMAILITITGMYFLMRAFSYTNNASAKPRRQWRLWRHKKQTTPTAPVAKSAPAPTAGDASTIDIIQPEAPAPITAAPAAPRPPRLNITIPASAPRTAPVATTPSARDIDEIRKIFEQANYSIKPSPQFDNFKPALMAIGTNESVWMGGIGIAPERLQGAINKLSEIFMDTLEDIEIDINGFIVQPTTAPENDKILSFDSIDALREYISTHPNPPVSADEEGNYAAYSEYIDTVITFIGKI